jgi:hypothetical protein
MARVQTTEDHVIADVARLRKDAPGSIYSTPDPSLSAPTGILTYLWVVWYALAWVRVGACRSLRIQATQHSLGAAWQYPRRRIVVLMRAVACAFVASQDPGIEQAGDGLRRVDECCVWVDVWVVWMCGSCVGHAFAELRNALTACTYVVGCRLAAVDR